VWTKFGTFPLTFTCDPELKIEAGQKMLIGFDPARGSLFEENSGNRL
jgi:multiple sugar transport system ATP-binding protein